VNQLKLLVTGATGFLGGHLVEEMVDRGYDVVASVRSTSSTDLLDELGVEKRTLDLSDPTTMVEATRGIDVVMHLAAYYTFTGKEDLYEKINVQGTRELLNACLKNGVKRVLYCSSTEAIGPVDDPPADEESPLNPTYEYGRSKAKAESLVRSFQADGVDHTILRPSGIYGPRNVDDVSFYFVTSFANSIASKFIVGTGKNLVQFVHVKDVVQGFLWALERYEESRNRTYIISEGRAYSYEQVYSILASILGKRPPRMHMPSSLAKAIMAPIQGFNSLRGKENFMWRISTVDSVTTDRSYSIERARVELGFSPLYDLEAGLKETVDWYQENGYI
jgi:dihydroflavonol-4-reductase